MEKGKILIDKFIVSNPDRNRKFVSGFIFEPTSDARQMSCLIEIEYKLLPLAEDLIWAKEFSRDFVDYLKNIYQAMGPSDRLDKSFEALLQSLNQWLSEQARPNAALSCLISITDNDNLYFAQIGDLSATLYQQGQIISLTEPDAQVKKTNKFSNLINGIIESGDLVIFSTSNSFDYFSKEKFENLLKNDIKLFSKKFNKHLENIRDKVSLGLIWIQNQPEKDTSESALESKQETRTPKKPSIEKAKAAKSESALVIASPRKSKITITPSKELPTELFVAEKAEKLDKPGPRLFIVILKKFTQLIKKVFSFLYKKLKIKLLINKIKIRLGRLSYVQKTLLVLFIIIAVIFVQSLIVLSQKEYKKRVEQKYASTIRELQNKQNEIKNAMIYKDETKVKSLLKDVEKLVGQLPKSTAEQYSGEFKGIMAQMYHQEYVEAPKVLADLSKIDNKIKVGGLVKNGDDIYVFNPDNNFIYQINANTGKNALVSKTSANVGFLKKATVLDKDSILFAHSNEGLAIFNIVDKSFAGIELATEHQGLAITDLAVYMGRLYLLDVKNNKIFKYTKTAGGFGKEESWLSGQQNLQGVTSLAADGSIYLLTEDGQIIKLFRGAKQDFKIKEIYPLLSKPIKISTWMDSKYIYILEPINKRLIILDKNGAVVKQIISNVFLNLTDFTVGEKEDTAWLLNGTKIYEIKLK